MKNRLFCFICKKKTEHIKKFKYKKKPKVEKKYKFFENNKYFRYYMECLICSHWSSNFKFDTTKFYEGEYNNISYQNYEKTFNKIIKLKNCLSDNYFRLNRIKKFLLNKNITKPKILDVGSGLGVFPYSMVKKGLECDVLDPDQNMINHMKKKIKQKKNKFFCSNFLFFKTTKKYDLITLNKVLEHINDPRRFLLKAVKLLKKNGYIYIELPDTEVAAKIGKNREEFTIEHIQGFTLNSINKLIKSLNLKLLEFKRINEPSGKFTFYCFVKK